MHQPTSSRTRASPILSLCNAHTQAQTCAVLPAGVCAKTLGTSACTHPRLHQLPLKRLQLLLRHGAGHSPAGLLARLRSSACMPCGHRRMKCGRGAQPRAHGPRPCKAASACSIASMSRLRLTCKARPCSRGMQGLAGASGYTMCKAGRSSRHTLGTAPPYALRRHEGGSGGGEEEAEQGGVLACSARAQQVACLLFL